MARPKSTATTLIPFLSLAGAVFILGMAAVPSAHAATKTNASCGITPADIAQITAVQNDPTLNASDEIRKELAVRRSLVSSTIACAEQDAKALKEALASTTVPAGDGAIGELQSQFLADIDQALAYYNSESAKLNLVGIIGTEQISQETLSWRESSYASLKENADDLMLWVANQSLFNTAQTRMAQTQRAVSFIESATPNADLQSALATAQTDMGNATAENQQARSALVNGFAPDQSLATIKQSLDSLSATYQDFFAISTIINGILPQ